MEQPFIFPEQKRPLKVTDYLLMAALTLVYVAISFRFSHLDEYSEFLLPLLSNAGFPGLDQDYYVLGQAMASGVRDHFIRILLGIQRIAPLNMVLPILHVLCVGLSVYSWYRMTRLFSQDPRAPFWAVAFVHFGAMVLQLGGNSIMEPFFVASTPALALCSLALYNFFKKRWFGVFVLLALAAAFQLLFALQLAFILFSTAWFKAREQRIRLFIGFLLFGLICVLMYSSFLRSMTDSISLEWMHSYMSIRAPHHFFPTAMPISSLIAVALIGIPAYFISRSIRVGAAQWAPVVGFIIIFCLALYSFLLEYLRWEWIGLSQAFKSTVWFISLSLFFLGIGFSRLLPWVFERNAIIISFLILGSLSYLYLDYQGGFKKPAPHLPPVAHLPQDLVQLAKWTRENTADQSIIWAPPDAEEFALLSGRPLAFHFKAIVPNAYYMTQWKDDLSRIYGITPPHRDWYALLGIARKQYYRVDPNVMAPVYDLRLIQLDQWPDPLNSADVLIRQGNWALLGPLKESGSTETVVDSSDLNLPRIRRIQRDTISQTVSGTPEETTSKEVQESLSGGTDSTKLE